MFRLTKKVAIITGGARGIGLEIARTYAKRGAIVHIFDIDTERAEREADLINASGGQAFFHTVDVTDQKQVKRKMAKINAVQPIDILVNNAAITPIGNAETTSEEHLDRVYTLNIKGVYNCIHAVIPFMKENAGGVIINMASVAGKVGIPDRFAYSMSKGAILSMTMQVAKDYLVDNIRCNSISPARIYTSEIDNFLSKNYAGKEDEMFEKLSKSQPLGRMGTMEEVASMALYLASDDAAFLTGCDYLIDGGFVNLNN